MVHDQISSFVTLIHRLDETEPAGFSAGIEKWPNRAVFEVTCSPLDEPVAPGQPCMSKITPAEGRVIAAALEWLDQATGFQFEFALWPKTGSRFYWLDSTNGELNTQAKVLLDQHFQEFLKDLRD